MTEESSKFKVQRSEQSEPHTLNFYPTKSGRLNSQLSTRNSPPSPLLSAAASALLLIFSFPGYGLFPLVWIALVPWLAALRRLTFARAFLSSLALGFTFFAGLLYWISLFGFLPWALLSLMQGLFITAAGICIWLCRRLSVVWRVISAASIWTLFEWLRGLGPYGFTWGWLGYSQSPWIDLIQVVSLTGVGGLTFLIFLHNAALAEAFSSSDRSIGKRLAPLTAVWAIILVLVLLGRFGPISPKRAESTLKVAILQPSPREPREEDVGQFWAEEEVILQQEVLEKLTRQAAALHPDLIIWPESALPALLNTSLSLQSWTSEIARRGKAWLLLGAACEDDDGKACNSAYLVSPQGEFRDRYDKVQLVPFGEFVPGRNWLPGLKYYPIRGEDLTPGKGFHTLRAGSFNLGVVICFESIFPHISRTLVKRGTDLLVIITNDGWFKRTAAPAQHRQAAVFRAVESRRWVARAASTGISCIISPRGEVMQELALYRRGVLTEEVQPREELTFYVRFGDWFIAICVSMAIICLIHLAIKRSSLGKRIADTPE
jgi:apolipoprotein N-acyltransferase